jgi:hypothetical protein
MILLFLIFLLFCKKVRKVLEKYLDDFLMHGRPLSITQGDQHWCNPTIEGVAKSGKAL